MFHKRLLKEFKCNQNYVIGIIAAQWVTLLANIIMMLFTADYLNKIFNRSIREEQTILYLCVLAGALLVRGIMNYIASQMSYKASQTVKVKLREKIYHKLMELGTSYTDTIPTSEAVQISTEGVEQLEIYFGRYVPQFFYSLLAPLTLFAVVVTMNWKVAIVLLICVPLIPVSIAAVQKFAKKMLQKYWGIYTELGDTFLESLQGLTTLKIYQADDRYAKKMDEEAERFRRITMKVLIMQLNSISIMDLISYGGAALGVILSILALKNGQMNLNQCFFTIMIAAEFFLPLRLLGSFFHIAMNGNAAADKIFRLLDMDKKADGNEECSKDNTICFHNLTFAYEDKNVLKNISFEMKPKGITALVGVSGCGKSTITSLIMKEIDPGNGIIKLGNTDITKVSRESVYKKITRIRHESYLFQGTIKENLCMGNPHVSIEEMLLALKKVNLEEFVLENGGLEMKLKEKASNLSGGQRQRLALARAILHNSDIYILDEATSNIDAESENYIMRAVTEIAKTKSVMLISHRLANAANADLIFMLDDGKIKETRTHTQLIAQNGYYSMLFREQQELENYTRKAGA